MGELAQLGFSCFDTSQCGGVGFPDLIIGRAGIDAKVELKTRRAKTERSKVTALSQLSVGQSDFARSWRGAPLIVAYDTQAVIQGFNELARRYERR